MRLARPAMLDRSLIVQAVVTLTSISLLRKNVCHPVAKDIMEIRQLENAQLAHLVASHANLLTIFPAPHATKVTSSAQRVSVNVSMQLLLFDIHMFSFLTACGDANCRRCSEAGTQKCSACNTGTYINSNNECVATCSNGYWESDVSQACEPCSESCLLCDDATTCRACEKGTFLSASDNSCHPCHEGCAECTAADSCVECSEGYHHNRSLNAICVNSCANDEFLDASENICQACPLSCATCSGSGLDNCIECAPELFRDTTLNVCVAECGDKEFKDLGSRTCKGGTSFIEYF
jgi:hypothetical protein